jgi:hypothetical protein
MGRRDGNGRQKMKQTTRGGRRRARGTTRGGSTPRARRRREGTPRAGRRRARERRRWRSLLGDWQMGSAIMCVRTRPRLRSLARRRPARGVPSRRPHARGIDTPRVVPSRASSSPSSPASSPFVGCRHGTQQQHSAQPNSFFADAGRAESRPRVLNILSYSSSCF